MHTLITKKIQNIQLVLHKEINEAAPRVANEPATLSQPQTPVAPLQRANEIPRTTPVSQQPNTFFASPKEAPIEKTGQFRNSLQELKNGNGASHDNDELSKLADKALAGITSASARIDENDNDAVSSLVQLKTFCEPLKTHPEQIELEDTQHALTLAESLVKEYKVFTTVQKNLKDIQKAQLLEAPLPTANTNSH